MRIGNINYKVLNIYCQRAARRDSRLAGHQEFSMTLKELKDATRAKLIAYLESPESHSHDHQTDEELRIAAFENFIRQSELASRVQTRTRLAVTPLVPIPIEFRT